MIGTRLGEYEIDSRLGAGAMGTVYLGRVDDGARVALKVLHPHLVEEPGFFRRFEREAAIGVSVAHDNVVRVLDYEMFVVEEKPTCLVVMEYVEGRTLRELMADLGAVPEALLREIALQIADGLAAIHRQGVVHRDIKPDNVLITDDHRVRIMDLGVAKVLDTSMALTQRGAFAGTLGYAAPEQLRGEDVTPAVDLYALGVTLFELATGANPFWRDDAAAAIEAHLNLQPPRLLDLNSEVTSFFSECIATLLAKKPDGRFESADALRLILEAGERSPWWTELEPQLKQKEAHLPKIRVRRETKLHGRAGDLEALHDAWNKAKSSEGNTVFLEGEAGIGKTRVVDEFLRGLEETDIHVLYGAYPPSGGLGGISNAIIDKFGEAGLVDALAPYLTVTPTLVPAFAAIVKHESPLTTMEPVQGDALNAACAHLLRALAAERPLIWIVENLDFASKDSRDTVLALARAVEGHRVLLIATARPGVPEDEQAHFSRLENYRSLALSRLGAREVIELLEDAFKSDALAEKLGIRIAKKSDGVPFFVFEMIRGLREGQFIKQLPDGSYIQTKEIDEIEVPSAVKDLIEGRMRGLSDEDRNLLDVGAVQGLEFDPDLVARVWELKRVLVLSRLAAIERGSGLVRAAGTGFCFDQNQIQEVIYGDLAPALRSEYHTLLAEAHAERLEGEAEGEDVFFLASHHLRGSRAQAGLPHLVPALDLLEKCYRNEEAIALGKRALETPKLVDGKERVEVLLRLRGRLDLLGRREEERAALDEALTLADETGDEALRAKVRQSLGASLFVTSQPDAAQATLQEALELARAAGDRKLEAAATGNLGNVFENLGRSAEAQEHFERARAVSREIGDRLGEAKATANLGIVFANLGRSAEAQEHYERARALFREIGDRGGEARATGNLGNVFWSLGRSAEAQEHFERYRAVSREIGDRRGEAIATGNLGLVFENLGRSAEAQEHFERARAVSREIGYRRGEALATGNLGGVFESLGRYAEAQEHHERHRALSREIGDRQGEGRALAGLAGLADVEEDAEGASRLYEEALALRRELGEKDAVAETLAALGRLEGARGETESATTHLDEALAIARETKSPSTILAATIEQARLPGGDVQAALAALEEHEERVGHTEKMEVRFRLWELTQDQTHLDEAHRLLSFMRDHAPEKDRDSMIENVPLLRDIMKAWEEQGGD